MDAYFCDRHKIPASDLIELKMDDFVGDIPRHLNEIYTKFALGDFAKVLSRFNQYLGQNPAPERKPHPPTPETIDLVDQYASDIIQKLGYSGNITVVSASLKPDKFFQFVSGEKPRKVL
jgi:hypothetical protein